MIQRALTGSTIKNKWWYTLKRGIKFEYIRYSVGLVASKRKKENNLVKDLKGTMRTGNTAQMKVKRLELSQHLEAKHTEFIIRVRLRVRESRPLDGPELWKPNVGTIPQFDFWRTNKVS